MGSGERQGSICEFIQPGSSAEGARIEAPKAPRGMGSGECPLPRNFFHIFTHNFAFCMHSEALLDSFESL